MVFGKDQDPRSSQKKSAQSNVERPSEKQLRARARAELLSRKTPAGANGRLERARREPEPSGELPLRESQFSRTAALTASQKARGIRLTEEQLRRVREGAERMRAERVPEVRPAPAAIPQVQPIEPERRNGFRRAREFVSREVAPAAGLFAGAVGRGAARAAVAAEREAELVLGEVQREARVGRLPAERGFERAAVIGRAAIGRPAAAGGSTERGGFRQAPGAADVFPVTEDVSLSSLEARTHTTRRLKTQFERALIREQIAKQEGKIIRAEGELFTGMVLGSGRGGFTPVGVTETVQGVSRRVPGVSRPLFGNGGIRLGLAQPAREKAISLFGNIFQVPTRKAGLAGGFAERPRESPLNLGFGGMLQQSPRTSKPNARKPLRLGLDNTTPILSPLQIGTKSSLSQPLKIFTSSSKKPVSLLPHKAPPGRAGGLLGMGNMNGKIKGGPIRLGGSLNLMGKSGGSLNLMGKPPKKGGLNLGVRLG